MQKFLDFNIPQILRSKLTKLRIGAHSLAVAIGRYCKPVVPSDRRFCKFCKTHIEDELLNGLRWVSTSGNNIPKNAVQGGTEINGTSLFVAKAKNGKDGQWTPGKAGYHLHGGCHFTYGGKEVISKEYDILTKDPNSSVVLGWSICSNGVLPNKINAVCTSGTVGLHVARGYHQTSLCPGKLDTVHRNVYVSYSGKEFTCERAEVLYQAVSSEDKLLPYEGKITKYQPVFHDIFSSLQKGVIQFSQFMKDLKSAPTGRLDDINFIKKNLFPSVETSKVDFEIITLQAQRLVQEINTDLEKSIVELEKKKKTLRKLDENIKKLKEEQKRKAEAVMDAEDQIQKKEEDLEKAQEALSIAMKQLHEEQKVRKSMKIAGGVLFAFGLGFIGAGLLIIDATALKDNVNSCRKIVQIANDQRLSSQISLAQEQSVKSTIDGEIYELLQKKSSKEEYFKEMGAAVDHLKDYQKLVIDLGEKVKNFDRTFNAFYGKFKVLHRETDGGYDLGILNTNTAMVLHALLDLLKSQSVRSTCDQLQLKEMKTYLLEIENLK